jgi:hypothetical protein
LRDNCDTFLTALREHGPAVDVDDADADNGDGSCACSGSGASQGVSQIVEVATITWGELDDVQRFLGTAKVPDQRDTCDFDVVVCCDVLYNYDFEPLLATLNKLLLRTGPLGAPVVLWIAYEQRNKDLAPFFAALVQMGCRVEEIPRSEMHPDYIADQLHIVRAQIDNVSVITG